MEHCVLLIEPNPIVGLDLADALRTAGMHTLGPLPDAQAALILLPHLQPACAVLGQERPDEASSALLQALRRRAVSVVLHASEATVSTLAAEAGDVPLLPRPAWPGDVVETVLLACACRTDNMPLQASIRCGRQAQEMPR